ncbi:hypothetical protein LEP1GSC037_1416 [Leptospira interrogans str. 2006001854]|uniref:Uncharacterized protein n=1 Tax=Leptospira interrogans str. 2006001854 TaxID=1001590 RepID=M6GL40_LEPIR|nr:hypothetical protein LEP1GSC037_1416 [Leptospira interrogans str. 2006001854]
MENIQFLFQRHLEAKQLEEEFSILTRNSFVYLFIKALITFLKYLSLLKRKFLSV